MLNRKRLHLYSPTKRQNIITNSAKNEKKKYYGTRKKIDFTEFEKSSIDDYKDRFARWHTKQIDLLSFSINLNFTISIAISGFIINNQDKPIFKDQLICDKYSLIKTALCLLAMTATIGILALIARLNDFRLTKNTIKSRRRIFEIENNIKYQDFKQFDVESKKIEKDDSKYWSTFLGMITWISFYLQVLFLLLTIWIIVLKAN